VIEAVRAGLAARANPAKAPDMQAYMKSAMPFLGVQKPARDALARELFDEPLTFDAWRDNFVDAVAAGMLGELLDRDPALATRTS
jgi:DNA alkylation repair enzyme